GLWSYARTQFDATVRELAQMEESAKEALRESEFRYKRLVENINDAIVVDDIDGRIVFASPRFLEWFGLAEGDLANVTLEGIAAPEWKKTVREYHGRRVRGESAPERFEYEGIRANGTRIWMEALVTTVERTGRVMGTQSALRDMTERRRIEEQSLQAQRLESVGRLAGGVAHDFNNLLTVILGYSATLLDEVGEAKRQREALEQIRLAAERAADLTQNLLAFSRQQVVKHRAVNVNLVVVEAEKMFGRLMGADVDLDLQLGSDLGMVMADAGQLQQVLMNMVLNARDSMPDGGVLRIETRNFTVDETGAEEHPWVPPGEYVYLSLSDTGTGMSEEVQQRVFEPFFTTKEQGKGTGLGLATAYGIVRQCGGWIGVRSRLAAGTTFHIYLPKMAGTAGPLAAASVAVVAARGWETVLLVEDQEAVRQITGEMLKNCGYVVMSANGGPEAMALARGFEDTIHMLVTDAVMPKMSGRELARILKAERPGMRVVIISGYAETEPGEGGDDGFEFLQKPFTPEVLAGKLRIVLES
ncbi:MAG: PAS domain S-box protein, partial [Bryobacteraceae bacterium]